MVLVSELAVTIVKTLNGVAPELGPFFRLAEEGDVMFLP